MSSVLNFLNSTSYRVSVAVEVKCSLNVMINKQKKKVLSKETNNDFVDVLLSFLMLPMGIKGPAMYNVTDDLPVTPFC